MKKVLFIVGLLLLASCAKKFQMEVTTAEKDFFPKGKSYYIMNSKKNSSEEQHFQKLLEVVLRETGMKKSYNKEKANFLVKYEYGKTLQTEGFETILSLEIFNRRERNVYTTTIININKNEHSLEEVSQCMFEALRRTIPSKGSIQNISLVLPCNQFRDNLGYTKYKDKSDWSEVERKSLQKHRRKSLEEAFYSPDLNI